MRYFLVPLIMGWFLGAASGLLFMHYYAHSSAMHERRAHHMRERFLRDLKASPEQKVKIESIIQESRKKLETIFAETRPRVDAVRQGTRLQIRALLNADQQARFDQLDAKMEKKFKARLERMRQRWH